MNIILPRIIRKKGSQRVTTVHITMIRITMIRRCNRSLQEGGMALGTSGPTDAAYECVRIGCIPMHVKETQSREPIIAWDESFERR